MKRPISNKKKWSRADRFITLTEIKKLIDTWPPFNKYRIITECQMFLGLRSCEAVSIHLNDIYRDFSAIRVRLAKTDKIVVRSVPEVFRKKLIIYVKMNCWTFREGYLFTNPFTGEHITKKGYWVMFKRARDKAGLNDYIEVEGKRMYRIGTHSLRRFFITMLYKTTKNPILVKDIIGWSDIRPLTKYVAPQNLGVEPKLVNYIFNTLLNPEQTHLEKWDRVT